MHIYHSRLHSGNNYTHTLSGKFSGLNRDELLVCRNTVLEFYTVDSHGEFKLICCEDLFTRIRSMAVMHLNNKDYVAIGSNSGYALVLAFNSKKNGFMPIMKKNYSMPVSLPESPGQFVAISHLGLGVGSLVETHLFFSLYKRNSEDMEKTGPLLAHQPKCITYDFVGLHNPNEVVPMFATLEVLCKQKQDLTSIEITNLPADMTEMELKELLKPYGTVITSRIIKIYTDLDMKSMGVGFVRMETQDICEKIISEFNGKLLPGSKEELLVKFSDDKNKQNLFKNSEQRLQHKRQEEKVENSDDYKQYLKLYQANFEENNVHLREEELPQHGNMLISVPQGKEHPFGVIVCFPDKLTFKPFAEGYQEVTSYLPQRDTDQFTTKRGFLLTSSVLFEISEGSFVILAQSEQGDLFSVKIYQREDKLCAMRILYVDTIPVASSMCAISGRLFVATEFGDNFLYDIKSFGNESEMTKVFDGSKLVVFEARKLENLSIVAKVSSISPVMQAYVSEFACNDMKKFIFACGQTPSSTLRFQRYGVKVSEVFEAVLPPLSNAVWSVNLEVSPGQTVTYILVSLMGRTMVLAIDKTIKVDYFTGFCSKVPTLGCATCSKDSIIQVNPNGFRHIRSDHKYTEKIISDKSSILRCALHCKQIAVALVNKDGLYFEVLEEDGNIRFQQAKEKTEFKSIVMCMSFIPRLIQAHHLVVCLKDTLEIYSVSLMKMECLTTYKLGRIPESLEVVTCFTSSEESNSIINIGYDDGYLQRIAANEEKIVSEYTIKLGNKAVKLYSGEIGGKTSVLALTNKAWISFCSCDQVFDLAPMDIDQKSDFAFISASSCPTANLIAISREIIGLSWETKLHFLSVSSSASMIEDNCVRLKYTPRSFIVNRKNKFLVVAETDIRKKKRKLFKIPGFVEMNPQRAMDLATSDTMDSPPEKIVKTIQGLESYMESLLPKDDVTKKPRFQPPKLIDTQNLPPKEDAMRKSRSQLAKSSDTESMSSEEDAVKSPMPGTSNMQSSPPQSNPVRRRRYAYPNNAYTRKWLPKEDASKEVKCQMRKTSEAEKLPPKKDLSEKPSSCAVDSRLHIFDPINMKTVFSEELPMHIGAVCMTFLQLKEHPLLLLVGTQRVPQIPGRFVPVEQIDSHDIYIYEVTEDGKSFSLVNKQSAKYVASSICQIGNHILVGHCKLLCLYGFHWSTKSMKLCDRQEAKHCIVNIWCHKHLFVVETFDEVLTYGYLEEKIDCLYLFHQDRFMKGVSSLCFWDDNIVIVGDRKGIHVVLLPNWNDCKEPISESHKNELKELEKRMDEHSKRLLAAQIQDVVEDIEYFDLDGDDTPPSGAHVPSPTSPISSSKKGRVETTFKIKSRSELAASRARPSSQDSHSPSRGGSFSRAMSSPSKAGPATSRTEESLRAESQLSTSSDPLDGSCLLPIKYPYSLLRFSDRSHVLMTHKIGEYIQSMQKTSLIRDGRELIVYTTLSGAVGVVVPFLTETHHKFFGPLEYLTFKVSPLLATELMAPLNPNADPGDIFALCCDTDQVTVDGNASEVFCKLPRGFQHHIASTLNTTYLELLQKIEKMKTAVYV